ncbi:MAG: class I SAM-dependent methyltransferase, partial [Pirellulales bacterium]|nr:class I SAM-dependent methyltransferase [Pirellulales bacterium]
WFEKIKSRIPSSVEYIFLERKEEYVECINQFPNEFDVIIIDGSHRYDCAVEAIKKLRDDGFIILDNSDWKELTSKLLRDADLIEVDMSGFGPINGYTWTTSFYFRRNVQLSPAHVRQPIHGIGSLKNTEA